MPILPVRNVGANGIIKDIPSVLLPVEGWSDGRNVRFDNGSVSKMLGHSQEFAVTTEPDLVQYWPRPVTPYYITATGNTVVRRDTSGNSASLVPAGTVFSATGRWRSSLFNGGYTVIMNNGVDKPQYITYGTDGAVDEVSLQPLPSWPDDLSAQVVVGHNYAMIAGNLRDASGAVTSYQSGTIRISSQAAPGGVPDSWTIGSELLTTADEFELANSGEILEIISLRRNAIVFTNNSIHSVTLPTATQATRVENLNDVNGILATGCAAEFDGQIFVVDQNDIYVTSGTGSIKSVADEKIRDYFFRNLHPDFRDSTFVAHNVAQDEMWICYVTELSTVKKCNEALIFNYRSNTWSIRDLPRTLDATVDDKDQLFFTGYSSISDIYTFTHLGEWNLLAPRATALNTGRYFITDPQADLTGDNIPSYRPTHSINENHIGTSYRLVIDGSDEDSTNHSTAIAGLSVGDDIFVTPMDELETTDAVVFNRFRVVSTPTVINTNDYSIEMRLVDAAGNSGRASHEFFTVTLDQNIPDSTSIHKADVTNQFNGTNFPAYVERKVLDFGDASLSKWAAEIYPLMDGSGTINIIMEGTNNAGAPVNLAGNSRNIKKQAFNIENDYKVDNRVNGRYLNIRFSSNNSDTWRLAGYSFDYTPDSRR